MKLGNPHLSSENKMLLENIHDKYVVVVTVNMDAIKTHYVACLIRKHKTWYKCYALKDNLYISLHIIVNEITNIPLYSKPPPSFPKVATRKSLFPNKYDSLCL